MRYIKGHLESIAGVEIYPIISLLIFVLFFIGLLVYVIKIKKPQIEYLSEIPLTDSIDPKANSDENE